MKILAIIMFFANAAYAGETHVFGFGGMNTFQDPMMIADTDAQDAKNVLTDEGDLRTLYGNTLYTVLTSSDVQFQREFIKSDGIRVLFVKAGDVLYGSNSAGALTAIRTFAAGSTLDMVPAFGRAYFTAGAAGPFSSVGTDTAAVSGMENCKYAEYYQTRLVCVNTSTEASKVALSTYNNPADWTTTASKDSAAVKYYRKDDGYGINCVFATPVGLFIGKDRAVGMLKGSDNETFYWKDVSLDVGCVDDQSVQLVDGDLVWLSQNGFYSWDFYNPPKLISGKIKPLTDKIRKSSSVDSMWTTNSQAAWELGTTHDNWQTADGVLTAPAYLGTLGTTMGAAGEGAEGAAYPWTVYPTGEATGDRSSDVTAKYGTKALTFFNGLQYLSSIGLVDAAGTYISSHTVAGPVPDKWVDFSVDVSVDAQVRLILCAIPGAIPACVQSPLFNGKHGGYISEYYRSTPGWTYYDHAEAYTGVIDTTTVDSKITTGPHYSGYSYETYGATVTFYTSSDNVNWTGPYGLVNTSTAAWKRYYKFVTSYTDASSSVTSMIPLIPRTTEYLSPVQFTAADISAWKLFSVSDSGFPTYSVRVASYAFASDASSPAFVSQTANAAISTTAAAYVQFRVNPNITTSTMAVTVNSVSLGYTVGQAAPRVASVVSDHRYICAVSTVSATANDLTLIWQRNKEWVYSDQSYSLLGLYNNQPMAGSGFKLWYIMDPLAKSFDGTTINSTWVSKDFYWVTLADKVIQRFWVSADINGVSNLGLAWQKNRNGVWVSKYTALNASTFVMREVEGLFDTKAVGRQFRFRVSAGELNKGFKLKMFSIYYDVNPLIK